jgi:hypothetical protein
MRSTFGYDELWGISLREALLFTVFVRALLCLILSQLKTVENQINLLLY